MTEPFNASVYLLDRHVANGDGGRLALTGTHGDMTYAELHDRVRRTAAGLRQVGLQPEQRLLMSMVDGPDFVTVFLAALRIGGVPVPVSTMLRTDALTGLLRDSRARYLAASDEFAELAAAAAEGAPELVTVLGAQDLDAIARGEPDDEVYATSEDSPAFWLYTSGTTGNPKGAMHRHGSIRVVCQTYGSKVLGILPEDRCLSASKAFFAYGLGNSVLFPLSVGAASVLEPTPSRPDIMIDRAQKYGATLFFGGPTFFANMLHANLPADSLPTVRLAASAGEPLPAELYRRWTSHFGIDIIDGIGMTEMLHIFLSNRPGATRPGTTGVAVPGYQLRILDDKAQPVPPGNPGTLFVRGDSAAIGYWSRYAASRQVFQGETQLRLRLAAVVSESCWLFSLPSVAWPPRAPGRLGRMCRPRWWKPVRDRASLMKGCRSRRARNVAGQRAHPRAQLEGRKRGANVSASGATLRTASRRRCGGQDDNC